MCRLFFQCLWRHVHSCTWAKGEVGSTAVHIIKLHHSKSVTSALYLWSATHYCLIGLDGWCHSNGGRKGPGLCHGRDSAQCTMGVVRKIAPGISSNSHQLTPLGAPDSLTQDHGMCPSTAQYVGALWHSNNDSCSNFCITLAVPGAVNWKRVGWRILAAQGKSSHTALQTAPYDPTPRDSVLRSSTLW